MNKSQICRFLSHHILLDVDTNQEYPYHLEALINKTERTFSSELEQARNLSAIFLLNLMDEQMPEHNLTDLKANSLEKTHKRTKLVPTSSKKKHSEMLLLDLRPVEGALN